MFDGEVAKELKLLDVNAFDVGDAKQMGGRNRSQSHCLMTKDWSEDWPTNIQNPPLTRPQRTAKFVNKGDPVLLTFADLENSLPNGTNRNSRRSLPVIALQPPYRTAGVLHLYDFVRRIRANSVYMESRGLVEPVTLAP